MFQYSNYFYQHVSCSQKENIDLLCHYFFRPHHIWKRIQMWSTNRERTFLLLVDHDHTHCPKDNAKVFFPFPISLPCSQNGDIFHGHKKSAFLPDFPLSSLLYLPPSSLDPIPVVPNQGTFFLSFLMGDLASYCVNPYSPFQSQFRTFRKTMNYN